MGLILCCRLCYDWRGYYCALNPDEFWIFPSESPCLTCRDYIPNPLRKANPIDCDGCPFFRFGKCTL